MQAEQINAVVDKLADKIGVAVGSMEPLAAEIVQEVVAKNLMGAGVCLAVIITAAVAARIAAKWAARVITGDDEKESRDFGMSAPWVVCAIVSLICTVNIVGYLGLALAPRLYLLRMLLE